MSKARKKLTIAAMVVALMVVGTGGAANAGCGGGGGGNGGGNGNGYGGGYGGGKGHVAGAGEITPLRRC